MLTNYYVRYVTERVRMLFTKPARDDPERWRYVLGLNRRYSVSSHGRVRMNEFTSRDSLGRVRARGPQILKPHPRADRDGAWIKLTIRGKRVHKNIGYLVAEHFLYRPIKASHVVWLNGDHHDNNIVNLAWKLKNEKFNRSSRKKQRRLSNSQ